MIERRWSSVTEWAAGPGTVACPWWGEGVGGGNDQNSYPVIKASCSSQSTRWTSLDINTRCFLPKHRFICGEKNKTMPAKVELPSSPSSPFLPSPVLASYPISDRQTRPGWHHTCHLLPQLPKWGFFSVSVVPSIIPSIWHSSNKYCFLLCALDLVKWD